MIRFPLIVVLVFSLGLPAQAGWNRIGQFNNEVASCAYFFNENIGLVGFGGFNNGPEEAFTIRRTTDGGKTWVTATMPPGIGRITSIQMIDNLNGYASVMRAGSNVFNPNVSTIFKTSDGGNSWSDVTGVNKGGATSLYVTSHAITLTSWGITGGSMTSTNAPITPYFSGFSQNLSNCVTFIDDLNGIVTMGPDIFGGGTYTYTSNDGGISWKQGPTLKESWGIYANVSTGCFFSAAEDMATAPGNSLYRTNDNGASWQKVHTFANMQFTGHIAGAASAIYIQTSTSSFNGGILRSLDNGATWVNVGGPSNARDTRFFVTGCQGEVVVAFDDQGGVFETNDGGDGSFVNVPFIAPIPSTHSGDSLFITVNYDTLATPLTVQEMKGALTLNDDLLTPDSIIIKNTQLANLLSWDTLYQDKQGVWNYDLKFKPNTKINGSNSVPFFLVKAKTYLTDTNQTAVTISASTVTLGVTTMLSSCTVSAAPVFTQINECTDSLFSAYMKGLDLKSDFSIRPNPTRGNLILSSTLPARSALEATIYNEQGVKLKSITLEASEGFSEHQLDLTGLSNGVYTILVKTSVGTVSLLKSVIQR